MTKESDTLGLFMFSTDDLGGVLRIGKCSQLRIEYHVSTEILIQISELMSIFVVHKTIL